MISPDAEWAPPLTAGRHGVDIWERCFQGQQGLAMFSAEQHASRVAQIQIAA